MINYLEGASVIDIGALRRAQANEDEIIEDDDIEEELSLDDEAALILSEIENDNELKKDVLEGFNTEESNDDLSRIAHRVSKNDEAHLAEMIELTAEDTAELNALNAKMIDEDTLIESDVQLEAKIAQAEAAAELDDSDVVIEEMSEADQELRSALPKMNEDGEYNLDDLQSCIEALLFYSDRPVSLKKLKTMLEMEEAADESILPAIEKLKASYQTDSHGFEVAEIAGGYQLRTKPTKAALLRKLAKVQVQRLSRGAMESLTLVAYKQPCTKDDIDQVRGVDSSHFIRTLLDRKLIEVSGRSEAAGRPMIYSTTDTFLEVFGLMDLKGLPPLHEIEAMVPQMAATEEGGEDPRVLQMRKMVHQMKAEANYLDYSAKEDDVILQEIKERVKSIDITTPYLARQKQLAEEGIHGEDAEALLAKEFGFDRPSSGGELISEEITTESVEVSGEEITKQDELLFGAHAAKEDKEIIENTEDGNTSGEY